MALLHAAGRSGVPNAVVACVDHGTQPEFARVQDTVAEASAEYGYRFTPIRVRPTSTSEADLRDARYAALIGAAAQHGCLRVVTGHTADDQAETVLHRVLRGTGLRGLSGMRSTRPLSDGLMLVRPLMTITRVETTQYLTEFQLAWCDDPGNAACDYTRNWLRNEWLPAAREHLHPAVDEKLRQLGALAGEAADFIESSAAEVLKSARTESPRVLETAPLLTAAPLLQREAVRQWTAECGVPLQKMTAKRWHAVTAVLSPQGPVAASLTGGFEIRRSRGCVQLQRTSALAGSVDQTSPVQPTGGPSQLCDINEGQLDG